MIACKTCNEIFKMKKIGVIFVEKDEQGKPYKLWSSDIMECPKCKVEVYNTGLGPYMQRHQEGFEFEAKKVMKNAKR